MPWLAHYGDVPHHIAYPCETAFAVFDETANQFAALPAYEFMGRQVSYAVLQEKVREAAGAFCRQGIGPGDRVLLCLPNIPQMVICFYALNYLGASAAMVHPLSVSGELQEYAAITHCKAVVLLDGMQGHFSWVTDASTIQCLIAVRIGDELPLLKRALFRLMEKREDVNALHVEVLLWEAFLQQGRGQTLEPPCGSADTEAAVLFTGGISGTLKGARISNLNLNAVARQTRFAGCLDARPGDCILAVLPLFHGFGLGVCMHTALANGGCSVLLPDFNPQWFAAVVKRVRPQYVAGVPAMFEALMEHRAMQNADLSCLKGIFVGGDTVTAAQQMRINDFLHAHRAAVDIQQGYGLTECVSVSCLNLRHANRPDSLGVPYPDVQYAIVMPYTQMPVPCGEPGEICLTGPTVMLGYIDCPEETARVLQRHEDGQIWLHTGDRGWMDSDGFVYFERRKPRLIITNGYNVFPARVEAVLNAHQWVKNSLVCGAADAKRGELVKAYIQLEPEVREQSQAEEELRSWCKQELIFYARPRELSFVGRLPTGTCEPAPTLQREQEEAQ